MKPLSVAISDISKNLESLAVDLENIKIPMDTLRLARLELGDEIVVKESIGSVFPESSVWTVRSTFRESEGFLFYHESEEQWLCEIELKNNDTGSIAYVSSIWVDHFMYSVPFRLKENVPEEMLV